MSSAALAPCTPFSGEMPRSEWEEFVPTAVTRVARSEDRLTATYTVDGQSKRKQQRFTTSLTELGDVLRALGEKVVADGVVDDRPCASASAKRARPTMPNDSPSPPRTFGGRGRGHPSAVHGETVLARERTVRKEAEAEVTRLERQASHDASLLAEATAAVTDALRTTAALEEARAQLARMTSCAEDLARKNACLRSRAEELEAGVEKQRRSSARHAPRRARRVFG